MKEIEHIQKSKDIKFKTEIPVLILKIITLMSKEDTVYNTILTKINLILSDYVFIYEKSKIQLLKDHYFINSNALINYKDVFEQ
jgi:hypothetical protein